MTTAGTPAAAPAVDWRDDRLVRLAGALAALPLAAYYLIGRPESVFSQTLSPTGLALAILAVFVPILLRRTRGRDWLRSGGSMVAAAMFVTTVFVFVVGPGNVWPIAIVVGTYSSAAPIVAGTLVGWLAAALVGWSGR